MTAIISKHGELLYSIQGNQETIELNKPLGCLAVPDPPRSNMYYKGWWVDLPKSPSSFHTFDYQSKQWVDPRTLEQIKDQKWFEIKSARDAFELGSFEFEGNYFDSDHLSQSRILGASIAGVDQTWTLANNTVVELTATQLKHLYQALQAHIAFAHERGRVARQAIFSASSKEEVEAIQF